MTIEWDTLPFKLDIEFSFSSCKTFICKFLVVTVILLGPIVFAKSKKVLVLSLDIIYIDI